MLSVDGLLMMGIVMPETCWAVSVRQSNKFYDWLLHLVGCFYLSDWRCTEPQTLKKKIINFKKSQSFTEFPFLLLENLELLEREKMFFFFNLKYHCAAVLFLPPGAVAPLSPLPSYASDNDRHFKHAQGHMLGVCGVCPTDGAKSCRHQYSSVTIRRARWTLCSRSSRHLGSRITTVNY